MLMIIFKILFLLNIKLFYENFFESSTVSGYSNISEIIILNLINSRYKKKT